MGREHLDSLPRRWPGWSSWPSGWSISAETAGMPLFAAWRAMPLPDDSPGRPGRRRPTLLREHSPGRTCWRSGPAGLTPLEAMLAGPDGEAGRGRVRLAAAVPAVRAAGAPAAVGRGGDRPAGLGGVPRVLSTGRGRRAGGPAGRRRHGQRARGRINGRRCAGSGCQDLARDASRWLVGPPPDPRRRAGDPGGGARRRHRSPSATPTSTPRTCGPR